MASESTEHRIHRLAIAALVASGISANSAVDMNPPDLAECAVRVADALLAALGAGDAE